MNTILSNIPQGGISITAGIGAIWSGGAVGITLQQDCSLACVTLLLQGYDGKNGQTFAVELWDNNTVINRPGFQVCTFNVPVPNDGSLAEFTFTVQGNANLTSGKKYWIFVYGKINPNYSSIQTCLNWVQGANPVGSAIYNDSLNCVNSNFSPSPIIPVFSVKVN